MWGTTAGTLTGTCAHPQSSNPMITLFSSRHCRLICKPRPIFLIPMRRQGAASDAFSFLTLISIAYDPGGRGRAFLAPSFFFPDMGRCAVFRFLVGPEHNPSQPYHTVERGSQFSVKSWLRKK